MTGNGTPVKSALNQSSRLRFADFEVDLGQRTLERDGETVALGAKPFALLELLLGEAPEVVSREAIQARLWPGIHVAENNLRVQLWTLRRALGDDAAAPRYVETVPGRGVRFVAPVIATPSVDERSDAGDPVDRGRRRILAVAAGLAGLAVGGGGLASLVGFRRPSAAPGAAYARSPGYAAYLRARQVWEARSREAVRFAIVGYREALALDPRMAPAMAGLAEAHLDIAIRHLDDIRPRLAFADAERWAARALAVDDRLPVAHSVLGHAAFLATHDLPGAAASYRRALALDPTRAQTWQRYGWFALTRGRVEVASSAFARALEEDRLGANPNAALGLFDYCLRDYDAAERQLEITRALHPRHGPLWIEIARLRDVRGDAQGAVAAFETARSLLGDESELLAGLAYNLGRLGRRGEAGALAARLAEPAAGSYRSPYHRAVAALGLGRLDEAARHLDRSWVDRSLWLPWLRFDHRLEPLGRFASARLERLGLPPRG